MVSPGTRSTLDRNSSRSMVKTLKIAYNTGENAFIRLFDKLKMLFTFSIPDD
jgi:hypothetical protein